MLKHGVTIDYRGGELPAPGDEIDPRFGLWFAGFCDGESCFSINGPSKKGYYNCSFIIKLRADDRPILEEIRDELRVGTIYTATSAAVGNRQPQDFWQVSRRTEVLWLTEFFDAYPLKTKKRRDCAVWREAAIAWFSGQSNLADYQTELRAARVFRTPELAA